MAEPFLSEIRIMSFGFPPKGWTLCNGQLLPINQNQGLFALLGTTYGGDGKSTFAMPDFRGNVPIHAGQGPGLSLYDLGQEANVVALSVTEGEDKPLKYPVMFRNADLVLLTKVDLLPHLPGYSVAAVEDALARVAVRPVMLPVSARTGEGMHRWLEWLETRRAVRVALSPEANRHASLAIA